MSLDKKLPEIETQDKNFIYFFKEIQISFGG